MSGAALRTALDRGSLGVMVGGALLVLQPWWIGGFRLGFAITGLGVVLQIVAAHLPAPPPPIRPEEDRP